MNNINIMQHMRSLGWLAVIISLGTWTLEWTGMVEVCAYCQTQRTAIGLLGILMLLPDYRYISQYLTIVLALFALHVSAAQIFANFRAGSFDNWFIWLASCAFLIIVGQAMLLVARANQKYT